MNSVIKGAGYILAHVPEMVIHNGTTQTTERIVNPDSEYLKQLGSHLRSYEDCVSYWPNQVYIGNATPEELAEVECQTCDVFEVYFLEKGFVEATREKFGKNPIITEEIKSRVLDGIELSEIENFVNNEKAEGLYHDGKLVGCVKRAHDIDVNLSAEVMHENIMNKATGVLSILYGVKNAGIDKDDVEYVIDCSEEACGDMNQRGGGNFAKAAAEIAGLHKATGSEGGCV